MAPKKETLEYMFGYVVGMIAGILDQDTTDSSRVNQIREVIGGIEKNMKLDK